MNRIRALIARLQSQVPGRDQRGAGNSFDSERPEDLAEALPRLPMAEALAILGRMEVLQAANVMVELPTETSRQYASQLSDEVLATYLDVLQMDDALDLADELEPERYTALLRVIPDEDADEIRRLMKYPRGSAGRVMTERFFWVGPRTTMVELLADLRLASEDKYETVNDVYVLDDARRLLGVFSLRKALRAKPDAAAGDVMRSDVESVDVASEDEDAARRMSRLGLYALPVVDDSGQMMGLFTGDDAQAILREAESEDVLAFGAVSGSAESYISLNVWQLFKRRMPWLLALFAAETLTGIVLRHYGRTDTKLGIGDLMFFVPLIIGAGGNVGSQVTSTITRALALDEVSSQDWLIILRRELPVAALIGAVLGCAGFLRAGLWGTPYDLSLVVALALPTVVLWAATIGSCLPLGAERLGIDPAVMSAPFISTFVDATGLVIYFEIALQILRQV